MRSSRVLVAVVLVLIGIVWVGQGSGVIAGSAMSGSPFWAAVGAVCLVVGAAIGLREMRARPAARP